MKRCVLLICMIVLTISVFAKQYEMLGRIFDAETEQRLMDATVTLINADNNEVLGSIVDESFGLKADKNNWFLLKFNAKASDTFRMKLSVELPGYKPRTLFMDFNKDFPQRKQIEEPIWVVKEDCDMSPEMMRSLKEVTVTATKIKMVMRGDTIVYDASAFQLSEGSMLDALVSQLPGVELNTNGQITVNGKFVNSLLVDGKDFFSGDPNVALRNLPAYIVKNIKVYDRNDEESKRRKTDMTAEDIVMDVRLKKQYQQGLLGNIEGGYGSAGSYMGRLFALEYARNGRVSVFANLNNINNDSRGPGIFGNDWQDGQLDNNGERRLLKAGVDWQWVFLEKQTESGRRRHLSMDGNVEYSNVHTDLTTLKAGTQFLSQGDRYTRSRTIENNRDEQLTARLYIGAVTSNWLYMALNPRFSYNTGRFAHEGTSGQFAHDPQEKERGEAIDSIRNSISGPYATATRLIYRNEEDGNNKRKEISTSGNLNISISNFNVDPNHGLNLYFDWTTRNRHYDAHENRCIDYREDPLAAIRQYQFTKYPEKSWSVSPAVRGFIRFNENSNSRLWLTYRLTNAYDRGVKDVYDLSDPFATVEEARLDAVNSFFSRLRSLKNNVRGEFSMSPEIAEDWRLDIKANAEIELIRRKLAYERNVIDTVLMRDNFTIKPDVSFRFINDSKLIRSYEIQFLATPKLADMTRMLNTFDNADPLNIYLGNPDLKTSVTYRGKLAFEQKQPVSNRVLTAEAYYYYYADRVSEMKIYDPVSGVNSYKPINIDGSYRVYGKLNYTTPIDHKRNFWLTTQTSADYIHNPDYISESTESDAVKEVVNNLSLSENLRVTWRAAQGYNFGLTLGGTWRNACSASSWFSTINAADLKGGLTANLELPGSITLATDFMVYKRVGYDDESLNTTDCVWNARVERSFFNGKLTGRIDAYDLLGQLSNVTTAINSLGRMETWTNSMRRYVLVSLVYKFNIIPSVAPTIN